MLWRDNAYRSHWGVHGLEATSRDTALYVIDRFTSDVTSGGGLLCERSRTGEARAALQLGEAIHPVAAAYRDGTAIVLWSLEPAGVPIAVSAYAAPNP
jgi:hypothetical protein